MIRRGLGRDPLSVETGLTTHWEHDGAQLLEFVGPVGMIVYGSNLVLCPIIGPVSCLH